MTDAVWPDGAREAVGAAIERWLDDPEDNRKSGDVMFTALEPFVQQRIEAALSDIDEMVPPAIGIYQTIPDRVRLVIAQRDTYLEDVRLHREEADRLRAEVARLREDGERLRAAAVDAINAVSDPAMGHLFRAVDAYDAARSAPGEGA